MDPAVLDLSIFAFFFWEVFDEISGLTYLSPTNEFCNTLPTKSDSWSFTVVAISEANVSSVSLKI